MNNEFIEAYSDDKIYLDMLENMVNSHSIESLTPDKIKYSSFCRLWAVMMIGSLECMIKEWAKTPELIDIYSYFEKNIDNSEKIERLKVAFELRGINIDTSFFADILAVKYIRNAYVHAEWNDKHLMYVVEHDFPTSLMSFDKYHLEKMKKYYNYVMNSLGAIKATF